MAREANDIRRRLLALAAVHPRIAYLAPFNVSVLGPRRTRSCPTGWPDLAGWLVGGRALLVEIKTPTDRLRSAQMEMQERAVDSGALYVVARDHEDLRRALEE